MRVGEKGSAGDEFNDAFVLVSADFQNGKRKKRNTALKQEERER